ncbi:hypothetical protein J2Z83_003767 [Virgibacillus natechei]|uniref:Uncharacterized protein n=1 Tax=Virgibacillus natechei TaxID=1216297 RepID=A0ABS4IMT9_9BACI|nr:hypothetical protein [Virgibacillus natechei]MBP1971616.1 hypothetical protein [Virgibacillus natechei]UZD13056.1 hypothetical protein OLD84_00305 [Virgibacillus natechei]
MKIKELFEQSNEYTDLQALIMFLTLEKQVLSMSDDVNELDLYFKEKHNVRMNKELFAYKKKMNMRYRPYLYEIKSEKFTYLYILAHSEIQARRIANENLVEATDIKTCDEDNVMSFEDRDMTVRTLVKNKKIGILGGFHD